MLEKLREGAQGPVAKVIIGLIIASFALAGVGGYIVSNTSDAVAKVNGTEIERVSLDQAYQTERARQEAQMGETAKIMFSDTNYVKQVRESVLERLIDQQLLNQAAVSLGLRYSDEQVKVAIRSMQDFQGPNGFDNDAYLMTLSRNNMSPDGFAETVRQEQSSGQLMQGLLATDFATDEELKRIYQLDNQQRTYSYVAIKPSLFTDKVDVSAEAIEQYYNDNRAQFMSAEQVKVEYVELTADAAVQQIEVAEQDAQDYYNAHQEQFSKSPRVNVAHIMVNGTDEAALAKAQQLQAELAQGADFATVAQKSDDSLTAAKGGELGWFDAGTMDATFEAAAFALAADGDVTSEPVKSAFGYHIIKRISAESARTLAFDAVKDQVIERVRRDKITDKFDELAAALSDKAFEVPDSLVDAALAINAEAKTSDWVTADTSDGLFANATLQAKLFAPDFVDSGLNSDIIELGPEHAIVVRVIEHQAPQLQALDVVSTRIREVLANQLAVEAAQKAAQELLSKWQAGEDVSALLEKYQTSITTIETATREQTQPSPQLVADIFSMSKALPSYKVLAAVSGEQFAVRLDNVIEVAEVPAAVELRSRYQMALMQQYQAMSFESLLASMRAAAKIEREGN